MKEEIIKTNQPLAVQLQSVADDLIQTLDFIRQEDINRIPFQGSWTAAQVGEHIVLSVSSITALLKGNSGTTNRAPDKYIQALKDMFLDLNLKFTSAPSITPDDKYYDKDILTAKLQIVFDEMLEVIDTKDLTDSCLESEFPGMGHLTRLEWLYQTLYHTQRHVHQLKNIKGYL